MRIETPFMQEEINSQHAMSSYIQYSALCGVVRTDQLIGQGLGNWGGYVRMYPCTQNIAPRASL
jgi:hypothetical protein